MDNLNFGQGSEPVGESGDELEKKFEEVFGEKKEESKEETHEETPETTEETVEKDSKTQALDSERARRKQAEKKLKELQAKIEAEKNAKEDEEKLSTEKESLKKELLEGDLFDEEVADKIVNTIGGRLLKDQIANERKSAEEDFDKEFTKFAENEHYSDAEDYRTEIKDLMGKGLTMEQAYRAAIPAERFELMRRDMEIEVEQKLLNSEKKAEAVDIGSAEVKGEVKRTQYTKKEQDIARETGMDIKEVHKRKDVFTLDEMRKLNKKE